MAVKEINLPPHIRKLLTALIIFIVLIGAVLLINVLELWGHDFYTNLWGPSYLLVHGKTPYDLSPLYDENQRAIWLPMAIGTFFPTGFLSQSQAVNLWFFLNLAIGLALIFSSSPEKRPSPVLFFLSALVFFMFPGTIRHLHLGQFTLLITLLTLLVAKNLDKFHPLLTAFFLALSLSKPQLLMLVLPGSLLAAYHTEGLRFCLQIAGGIVLWCVVLTLPLFLAAPGWPADFLNAMGENPDWAQPGIFSRFKTEFGNVGIGLWAIIALAVMAVNLWLWWKFPPSEAIFWSLALTPLVSPYIWSWDFVMLLPLLIRCLIDSKSSLTRLCLLIGYGICWLLMIRIATGGNFSDDRYWWVSWFIFGITAAAYLINRKMTSRNVAQALL